MNSTITAGGSKDPRQATTVKIRKDRYGNAYMADATDDLVDGAATLIHRAKPEGALVASITAAITLLNEGRGWEAKQLLITARAQHFKNIGRINT